MGHGVSINEVPTGVRPPVEVTAGLPVYVGTAPINDGDLTVVNKPVKISTLAEFVAIFGPLVPSSEWDNWTLHEAAKAHFSAYSVSPIVCVNVIDPDNVDHVASATGESHQLVKGQVQLQVYGGPDAPLLGILKSSVVVKVGASTKTLGTDYTLAFDKDGFLVVTRVSTGSIPSDSSVILVDFDYLDPSGVTSADIIGGYSGGVYTGLEVVEQVYPKLRLVPGFILAPKWSQTPAVAARMATIAGSINGSFRAMALTDLSTDPGDIASYAAAPAWKSTNGFDSVNSVPCWPLFKNGDDVYHMSTMVACVANVTDAAHDGIPYASPSNKSLTGTSAVLDDGAEVLLTRPQANALNDQGIVTALNGFNGWRVWGNRTGGYPGTTDPKDAFIPIRRMFNWVENTIILTTDRDVDEPGNKRLIDGVVGTNRSLLNGLVAAGALVDGKIEFRKDENPVVDLSDGKIRFHVTLTPPSPAQTIEFITEYDPAALAALFA
jgi:phage tail sheath protein FI